MWVWIGDLIDRQMHWLGTSHIQTRSRWNEWAVTGEGGKERRRNVWYAIARQNQQILFRNQSSTVHMCTVLVCFQPLRVNGQCPVERRLIDRRPANQVCSFVHVYNTCTDYQFYFCYCRVYDSFSNICNNTRLFALSHLFTTYHPFHCWSEPFNRLNKRFVSLLPQWEEKETMPEFLPYSSTQNTQRHILLLLLVLLIWLNLSPGVVILNL